MNMHLSEVMDENQRQYLVTACLDELADVELFKALCEPVRVEILTFLAVHGPSDIGRVAQAFPQDRSVISRHLQLLANAGVLDRAKQSRSMIYSVNGTALLERMEAIVERTRALVQVCCPPAPEDP